MSNVPRFLSICDWLPPDFGAVGQYALLDARHRASAGADVVLVGLSSSHASVSDEALGRGRLRVVRLRRPVYDRGNFVERALWTLVTNTRLAAAVRAELVRADEALFTGSPPFLIHWLVPMNRLYRRPLTYRITDFFPEVLMAERPRVPLWLRALHWRTVRLRRRLARIEVLGQDQRERLRECGVPDERILLRPDQSPIAIPPGTKPLEVPESLRGRAVLLYSGNFGVAHDHETFVAAYRRHHRDGSGRVALWLNAIGAKADLVEAEIRRDGLLLHRSRPGPLEELPRLLVTPAAHLITLRDAFVGYVLPSKVHGCVLSGRDILFVGSPRSDVHRLCAASRPSGGYLRVDVGDVVGAFRALEAIADRAVRVAL